MRSEAWLAATGCQRGATIWFVMPEMGVDGWALVKSVGPCPPIEPGPGRVVLSTVTHLNSFVLRIWLDGQDEPIEPTDTHRLYSEGAGDWVPAGELTVGDRLRTLHGSATITRIDARPGTHRVYNLEVETEHCYFASMAGVLSHNEAPCGIKSLAPLRNLFSQGALKTKEILDAAIKWLGEGYIEVGGPGSGVFRSADGLRQFRMTTSDLTGAHGPSRHIHFESLDSSGTVVENLHVPLAD